jgi:hypothetical protein
VPDIAHQFAGQVLDRGEDSAGDDIALDPGEPVFDLIEPGGVGRGVMEMDFGMSREELLNSFGLVGRKVVGNEMDLLAARLIGDHLSEEGHKLLAGVARGGFGQHLAIARVKRGIQRKRAVAVVLKAVALQPPRRQWQDRIEPIQGLDGGLFVDAKHRRMLGRFDVQPNNVGGLELKIRIVGSHVTFDPMGLEPGALPHPRHHHMADAQVSGQLAAAPVRGTIRRGSAGPFQNPGLQRRSSFLHRSSGMMGVQARQSLSLETTLPATDIVGVASQDLANRQVGLALRQQQDRPRAVHLRPATCASASGPAVPCARSASSETLLHPCLMIHECDTNLTVTGH